MAQNVRDLLSNRKFAIPLMALLGICFVGLLLLGFVLILPGLHLGSQSVAQATPTEAANTATSAPATPTKAPTATPRPSPTLVPVGTVAEGGQATATPASAATTTPVMSAGEAATATAQAAPTESVAEASPTPGTEDDELAETGIGWGLIFISGGGLAAIAVAARRLRMAG